MPITIITDSASDIEQEELPGVRVLPMTVTIDGTAYHDGIDLNKNEFYDRLENSSAMPVTSLISPYRFEEAFRALREGEEAIVITMSGALSGTYQSAVIAAEGWENVSVIDSRQVAAAEKILVQRGLELIAQGLTRAEIVEALEAEKEKVVIFASVDTLEYLLRGGRISKTSALVGGIIGIKPILTLEDGKLIPIGKARGSKQSNLFLNRKIEEVGGIDTTLPYAVGYSGSSMANLCSYLENNQALLDALPYEPPVVQIGSTVGTHAGPGAVLVTFFKKN